MSDIFLFSIPINTTFFFIHLTSMVYFVRHLIIIHLNLLFYLPNLLLIYTYLHVNLYPNLFNLYATLRFLHITYFTFSTVHNITLFSNILKHILMQNKRMTINSHPYLIALSLTSVTVPSLLSPTQLSS